MRSPLAFLRALRRDERGASALEFAIIAPMMIVVFMGLVETGNVVVASRRSQHSASALGDLVAQSNAMNDAAMADCFAAAQQMIAPMSTTNLTLKVTSVTMNAKGQQIIDWSKSQGMSADSPGGVYTGMPAGLLTASGDSAIVAVAKYTLVQASKSVIGSDIAYNRITYAKPRKGSTIPYN